MHKFFFLLTILFSICLSAQTESPALPLRAPLEQTSNFAEYRKNHFHGGLDLRVINKGDRSVFSIWDGYVSRIRFNAASYGRAVYITHPNAYTSVYGHLNSFIPEIDSIVKNWQYKNQEFSIDIEIPEGKIQVKKGQKIGVAGNSGYSFGAHLHFEIRKTEGQIPVNPANFYDIRDQSPPVFNRFYVYTPCKGFDYPLSSKSFAASRQGRNYTIRGIVEIPDSSFIGFDVQDFQTGGWSRLLPYMLEIKLDEEIIWKVVFDEFSFNESKACASLFDHKEGLNNRKQIIRTIKEEANLLNIYKLVKNNGYIVLNDNKVHNLSIKASDTEMNSSLLNVQVKRSQNKQKQCDCHTIIDPGYFHEFITDHIHVKLDTFTFFGKYCLEEAFVSEFSWHGFLSWKIGNKYLAIRKAFEIIFLSIDEWPEQYVFAEIQNGKIRNAWLPEKTEKGTYHFFLDKLGTFALIKDSIPPQLKKTNVRNGIGFPYHSKLTFIVTDNSTEIPQFNAFINENWVLMEYDYKNNLFYIPLSREMHTNMKSLKVEFFDLAGNKCEQNFDFLRP